MHTPLNFRSVLLLSTPPLLWALNAIIGRQAVGVVPPITLNALRWVLALLILLPFCTRLWRQQPQIWTRWGYLSALGLLGMASYNALQYLALHTSTPLNVTLITASSPVWSLAIGAIGWRVQPSQRQMLGAVLSLIGVALVVSRGQWSALWGLQFVPGDLLMVIATIGWSLYSWLLSRPPAHMQGPERPTWNWAEFLALQTVFSLPWCGLATGAEWAMLENAHITWSGPVVATLLFIALGPALLAYRCWGLGVAAVGPALAGFFVNLTPLFAALLSAALLGEWPQWFHGAAFALIVVSIVISNRPPRST